MTENQQDIIQQQCATIERAVLAAIYEHAIGVPLPIILGVLHIVAHDLIERAKRATTCG